MMRLAEIEMMDIGIDQINAQLPTALMRTIRPIEMLSLQESAILRTAENPTQIIVTDIQTIVITVQRTTITIHYFHPQRSYMRQKVVVYFIHIIVLLRTESQFVSHPVGQETDITTQICAAPSGPSREGKQP